MKQSLGLVPVSARFACLLGVLGASAFIPQRVAAQAFQPGDLVVTAYGNSSTTTQDGQLTAISLMDFSPSGGAAVKSVVLPVADGVGGLGNLGVVGEYGSSSEGNLQPSADGRFLTLGAYGATASANGIQAATNAANGTTFPAGTPYNVATIALGQSADTDVPRIAVLIDVNGNVNSATALTDLYNTNNPRAVYTSDGTSVYLSGQGDGLTTDQGIFLVPAGLNTGTSSTTPTGIYNSVDTRFVTAYGGNLYFSVDKKAVVTGIFEFTGLPTASASPLPITPASNGRSGSNEVNYSPEGFFFANPSLLYVADTGQPKNKSGSVQGAGGIQKWVLSGGVWSLAYVFNNPAQFVTHAGSPKATTGETGFEAITGKVSGDTIQLYAVSYTAADDQPNGLYTVTDVMAATANPGAVPVELESAAGNGAMVFKGVAIALSPDTATDTPAMPTWALVVLGSMVAVGGAWMLGRRPSLA
jgi:hypothetical protein